MKADVLNAVSARGLVKTHVRGDSVVHALRGVDIDIAMNDFVAICGPSGSGKSTLLNVLGLLEPPDGGEVVMDGLPVPMNNEKRLCQLRGERLGFVFQNFNLVPTLSGLENVELPLYATGLSARERCRRAMELLHAVGLHERMHNRPSQMSGGQQQRVAVARALVREPLVVLADEPTANLDRTTSEHLLDLMLRMNEERGTAFVIATHDPHVMARARRVVQLTDGMVTS
jgi:putative ABC transport system ATP-binding protein